MAESPSTTTEYAIFVSGAGWVSGADAPPYRMTVGAMMPTVFQSLELANDRVKTLSNEYRRLGQPQVSIEVFVRAVTVTRDKWKQVVNDDAAVKV